MSELAPRAAYRVLGEERGNSSTAQWTLSDRKASLPQGPFRPLYWRLIPGPLSERRADTEQLPRFTCRNTRFDSL